MNSYKHLSVAALGLTLAGILAIPAVAQADRDDGDRGLDFGLLRDRLLEDNAEKLFGIERSVREASTDSIDAATAEANPLALVTLARGLRAKVVSASADLGANIDMMTLYPRRHPTHIIACNEQGATQPGLQRVRLSDGKVETILMGTISCDPAHTTPWGTVLFGEENGSSGTLLEIIDPLHTTGVMYDRVTGLMSGADAANVIERPALGHLSYEGVVTYPNGVIYYGDENRPGNGVGGGAYFKFIPTYPWMGGAPITKLDQSPLTSGSVYGLRLGKRSGGTDYGQGTETGQGTWIEVISAYDANLRAEAANLQLTGYYRPEDASADENALADGNVRLCANNTGNEESDRSWGNAICLTDGTLEEAVANTATPEVQLFVVGTPDFSMMDNIAYQPRAGKWIMHEDRDAVGISGGRYPFNNSIWMCLEDGGDADTLSDGCLRIVTLNDLNAESTGGFFDETGKHYYFSVQHNVTGHGVILDVTGWGGSRDSRD
jgi:secreted PhoX family phosphatase